MFLKFFSDVEGHIKKIKLKLYIWVFFIQIAVNLQFERERICDVENSHRLLAR